MNGEERIALIRKRVLEVLDSCRGYLLADPRLVESLQADVMPPPTSSECEREIGWCAKEGFIAGVYPELGGPVKWKLTDKGRAAL